VVFIANPNNPTGTMATSTEVEEFMAALPPRVILVYDQAYYEYVQRPDYPEMLRYIEEGRNIVVLRTFSKAYGLAGLRIGYGITREGLARLVNLVRSPFNTTRLAQLAAAAALDDDEHVKRTAELTRKGREQLYKGLRDLGFNTYPSEGNFLLFDANGDGRELCRELEGRGIILRPMGGYGLPRHVRVTVGTTEQNEMLLKALAETLRQR
jgi:histidinol-phosphate aminotransferase